jgi:hypothetical protein
VHALDLASRLMGELADDPIWRDTTQRSPRGPIPRRPDRVELAVLSALAGTYGADLLTNAALGYALRLIARHGGIAFVQRALWGPPKKRIFSYVRANVVDLMARSRRNRPCAPPLLACHTSSRSG